MLRFVLGKTTNSVFRRCLFTCTENKGIAEELYARKQVIEEEVTPWKLKAMASTLETPCASNNQLLPGWHQLFCLPTVPTSNLSDDGYEADFAPPEPYIARMWGGSKVLWSVNPDTKQSLSICVGDTLRKTSFIENISFKEGKKSGNLLILDLVNEYRRVSDDQHLLRDTVSMIYRTQPFANAVKSERNNAQSQHRSGGGSVIAHPSENPSTWIRTIHASPILLFRYSALTFNAHMIHYDQDYAASEGFNNTLVHGPLQAQLLLDHISRIFPDKSIQSFSYRALAPLENLTTFKLVAEKVDDTKCVVSVVCKDITTMKGEIYFAQ